MVQNDDNKEFNVEIDSRSFNLYRKADSKEKLNLNEQSASNYIKYGSLAALTFQNCSLNLLMRMSRTQKDLFISSTAVFLGEIVKLFTCLVVLYIKERKNV